MVVPACGQNAPVHPLQGMELVQRAFAAELSGLEDTSHPMRYTSRKSSPRLITTKDIIETRDGPVAMIVSVNDHPVAEVDATKEHQRLDDLLADPGKQHHRKQGEEQDLQRAAKVLRVMPNAFLYQYAGPIQAPTGTVARYLFSPNPAFTAPDLETEVLTAMTGEIWIDPVQVRVIHLQGSLQNDVEFGWGVLGRLYKGGWINIDNADIGGGVWRVVHFQINMSARVLIRTRIFETTEDQSHFTVVPPTLDYRQAIAMLRSGSGSAPPGGP